MTPEQRQTRQDEIDAILEERRLQRQHKKRQRSNTPPLDVPFNVSDANAIIVILQATSGSNGDKDTPASWVYTAYTVNGAPYAPVGLSPLIGRENGAKGAATYGIGYIDSTNAFRLVVAFERPATGGC